MRVLAVVLLLSLPRSLAAEELCPGIAIEGARVALTAGERRLLCGDPQSEAWKTVPRAQAEGFFRAFLQQRAYHSPAFSVRDDKLVVDPGPRTLIKSLSGSGVPAGIDLSKRRRVIGQPMTPAALDAVQAALLGDLQNRGYACPEIEMSADPRTGDVRATVSTGVVHIVERIEEPELKGIDPAIFRRFEAFQRGKPLDQRLLSLTSDRIVSEALFLNSRYDVTCTSAGVRIAHVVTPASPRLVRLGVGVDTEGLVRLRAQWQHSRIGWRASSAEATLLASAREQSLEASQHLYVRPDSRVYLLPRALAARSDEPAYETVSSELSLMPAVTWDDQLLRMETQAGPALEYADTRRGLGPVGSTFLVFNTHTELTTHLYEYFLREPRRGFRADLDTASRAAGVASRVTAHRVRLSTEKLWNLGAYDPPLIVLGARGWVGTTFIGDRQAALADLPPDFRFFLGGDADFRGASRQRLPSDENGFLTAAYEGLELRLGDVLPYKIQPLVFIDAAMGGLTSFHLDPDVYYAPGFGARWSSPVGAFRFTLARDLIWRRDPATAPQSPHWQFFFSYGLEF